MNVLVLGGTRFLGRHIADALVAREHRVTLFNRGISDPEPRENIAQVRGDRERDLALLQASRWDAVVDTSCYKPETARRSADFFAERTDRYLFISTISVYALAADAVITEDTPLALEPAEEYGPAKARCEAIVRSAFGDRATIVRPGLIVGPFDPTDRFTYWPVRIAQGGEVLAPVGPDEPVQFIDARDLANFCVRLLERGEGGAYNVTSPRGAFTIGEVLSTCTQVADSRATFTWVDEDFLTQHGVQQWIDLPLWVAANGGARSIVNADVGRALASGLTLLSLRETVRDTLSWALAAGKRRENLKAGLSAIREGELLSPLV